MSPPTQAAVHHQPTRATTRALPWASALALFLALPLSSPRPQSAAHHQPRARLLAHLSLLLALSLSLGVCPGSAEYGVGPENATATFYGGLDASATMGGACGYGNLYETGYGTNTAAASIAMWDAGGICGACFRVTCFRSKWCIPGASVVITVTNQCPQGSEGGWCNMPHRHLDMAVPAWQQIGRDLVAGVISTNMERVPCIKQGGIKFRITGSLWWTQVTVFNVGGSGDVAALDASVDRGLTWKSFHRNWGTVWSYDGGFRSKSLSFRVKTKLAGESIVLLDVMPSDWKLGQDYEASDNFRAPAAPQTGSALALKMPSSTKRRKPPPPKRRVPAPKKKSPPKKKPRTAPKQPPCSASRKGSCVTIQSVEPPPPPAPKKGAPRRHWPRFRGKTRRGRRHWVWRRGSKVHA